MNTYMCHLQSFAVLSIVLLGLQNPVAAQCPPPGSTDPSQVGQWGSRIQPFFDPALPQPFPMHMILLKNGNVLIFPSEEISGATPVVFFDPVTETVSKEFSAPDPVATGNAKPEIPCSGHVALPDGRILLVGGGGDELTDRRRTTIFDPDRVTVNPATGDVTCNDCWIDQDLMAQNPNTARFYPTCTVLADGRVLVMAGASNSRGCQLPNHEGANTPTIFDLTQPVGSQWTRLTGAESTAHRPRPRDRDAPGSRPSR